MSVFGVFWSLLSCIQTEHGNLLIKSPYLHIQSKCEKIWTRNSEYRHTNNFQAVQLTLISFRENQVFKQRPIITKKNSCKYKKSILKNLYIKKSRYKKSCYNFLIYDNYCKQFTPENSLHNRRQKADYGPSTSSTNI